MRILKLVPDLQRLRISSIDSIEVDPAFMEAIATEPRLMPHLTPVPTAWRRLNFKTNEATAPSQVTQLNSLKMLYSFGQI